MRDKSGAGLCASYDSRAKCYKDNSTGDPTGDSTGDLQVIYRGRIMIKNGP